MTKILVTGGNGFIGRRLVAALGGPSDHIRVLEKEGGGILNRDLVQSALDGVDTIYHLGAVSGYPFFPKEGLERGVRTNCDGTAILLEEAVRVGVRRVVMASTMSCYAFTPVPHTEDGPVTCPNPYVATKLFGERLMRLMFETKGLATVILRFSSVYGIGEESKGPVANPVTLFTQAVARGEDPVVYGDGTQTRDLLFVDDAVAALILAAGPHVVPGTIYNVATGEETTYNRACQIIGTVAGKKVTPRYQPWDSLGQQKDYITRQLASFERFHAATGWTPKVTPPMGLARVWRWTAHKQDTPFDGRLIG